MSIVVSTEARIRNIKVTSDTITAYLVDGRVVSVPLAWSWRLSEATPGQRANFKIIGDGQGVHWPDVDEDISLEGMLHGVPAHRPSSRDGMVPARPLLYGSRIRYSIPVYPGAFGLSPFSLQLMKKLSEERAHIRLDLGYPETPVDPGYSHLRETFPG